MAWFYWLLIPLLILGLAWAIAPAVDGWRRRRG
jgi:hypothetical protein